LQAIYLFLSGGHIKDFILWEIFVESGLNVTVLGGQRKYDLVAEQVTRF